jgi:hypothetical protein
MHISINLDTSGETSQADINLLLTLAQSLVKGTDGSAVVQADRKAEQAAPAVVTATPAKKAAAPKPKPEPEPEPEPEEDLIGGGDALTVDDAVNKAQDLVTSGKSSVVKKALAAVGAKRVGELEPNQVADFVAALEG